MTNYPVLIHLTISGNSCNNDIGSTDVRCGKERCTLKSPCHPRDRAGMESGSRAVHPRIDFPGRGQHLRFDDLIPVVLGILVFIGGALLLWGDPRQIAPGDRRLGVSHRCRLDHHPNHIRRCSIGKLGIDGCCRAVDRLFAGDRGDGHRRNLFVEGPGHAITHATNNEGLGKATHQNYVNLLFQANL